MCSWKHGDSEEGGEEGGMLQGAGHICQHSRAEKHNAQQQSTKYWKIGGLWVGDGVECSRNSRMEWNGKIKKIKEKQQYHHSTPYQWSMSSWTNSMLSIVWSAVFKQREGRFSLEHQGVCDRNPLLNQNHCLLLPVPGDCHQSRYRLRLPKCHVLPKIHPIIS